MNVKFIMIDCNSFFLCNIYSVFFYTFIIQFSVVLLLAGINKQHLIHIHLHHACTKYFNVLVALNTENLFFFSLQKNKKSF